MLKVLLCLAFVATVAQSAIVANNNCMFAICPMMLTICPNGRPAPVAPGECCPSLQACFLPSAQSRANSLLTSLLGNGNILNTLAGATQGTDLGTVISILNLLHNVELLSNDIHQIPVLINQTLASLVNGAGEAGQIIIDQLVGAVNNIKPQPASRDLLSLLGQNGNLLSGISGLLPQGTSIATVLSILKLLSNINALSNDIHQIPVLLNETLTSLIGGAGEATQIIVQQLMSLVGIHNQAASRTDILSLLGQNANLLSILGNLLPQGTSISTVISLLNFLSNINALNNDIHQIPALIQETLQGFLNGIQNPVPLK